MVEKSLAHSRTVPEPTRNRAIRGVRLANAVGDDVKALGGGRFSVPGCSGGEYVVTVRDSGETCSCPDYRKNGRPCKHIYCLFTVQTRRRAARPARFAKTGPVEVEASAAL